MKQKCTWLVDLDAGIQKSGTVGTIKRQHSLASVTLHYLATLLKLMCVLSIVLPPESPSPFHLSVKSLYTSRLQKSFKVSESEGLGFVMMGVF